MTLDNNSISWNFSQIFSIEIKNKYQWKISRFFILSSCTVKMKNKLLTNKPCSLPYETLGFQSHVIIALLGDFQSYQFGSLYLVLWLR